MAAMKLYIAFGSNLCKSQMRKRCPTARPLGKFMLTNARLIFRGVADLEYAEGAKTPCGLYAIYKADEDRLDGYEGVDSGVYFKSETVKLKWEGEQREALVYLMNSTAVYPPSQTYADIIRRGYKDFDLDQKYLDEAIQRSYQDKNPDEYIIARRRRQRAGTVHRELVKKPPNGNGFKAPSPKSRLEVPDGTA